MCQIKTLKIKKYVTMYVLVNKYEPFFWQDNEQQRSTHNHSWKSGHFKKSYRIENGVKICSPDNRQEYYLFSLPWSLALTLEEKQQLITYN